jgi:hypothetical protein
MNDIDAIEENDSSVFELKIDDEISFRPRNSLGVRRKSLAPIDINTSDINLSNQSTPIKSPLVKGSSSKIPIQHNSPIRYSIGGSSINDENIANDGRISPLLMPLNNTDDTQLENNSPLLISINDRPIVLSEELITEEYEIRNGSPLLLSIDEGFDTTAINDYSSIITIENNVIIPKSNSEKVTLKNRRVSLELCMHDQYDESLNLPKYSEAEFQSEVDKQINMLIKDKEIEHKNLVLNLQKELEKKDKDIVHYNKIYEENNNELLLQRAQTKAVSHRLQTIETELKLLQKTSQESLISEKAKLTEKLKAESENIRITENNIANSKILALEETLNDLRSKYEQESFLFQNKEKEHKEELINAVNDAKAHVYTKAKAQFDQGNKEYLKVKQQLKDVLAENKMKSNDLDNIKVELRDTKYAHDKYQMSFESEQSKTKELISLLLALCKSIGIDTNDCTDYNNIEYFSILCNKAEENITHNHKLMNDTINSLNLLEQDMKSISVLNDDSKVKINELEFELKSLTVRYQLIKNELIETQKERDCQMDVTAKLTTVAALAEEQVEKLSKELNDSNDRSNNLRKMNEELLQMLESSMLNK